MTELSLVPRPLYPYEIWQAITSPPTLEQVPRSGWGGVFWNNHHSFVKMRWERFAEIYAAEHGRDLERGQHRLLVLNVRVEDTYEEAVASMRDGHDEFWKFLGPYGWSKGYMGPDGRPAKPGLIPTLEESLDQKTCVVGTAEQVAEFISTYDEQIGLENLLLFPRCQATATRRWRSSSTALPAKCCRCCREADSPASPLRCRLPAAQNLADSGRCGVVCRGGHGEVSGAATLVGAQPQGSCGRTLARVAGAEPGERTVRARGDRSDPSDVLHSGPHPVLVVEHERHPRHHHSLQPALHHRRHGERHGRVAEEKRVRGAHPLRRISYILRDHRLVAVVGLPLRSRKDPVEGVQFEPVQDVTAACSSSMAASTTLRSASPGL